MATDIDKQLIANLDPKHKIFADRFLETGRMQQSAEFAGYAIGSAHVSANRLLKRPDIQAYLAAQGSKLTEQTENLQSKVLSELSTLAFTNIADFIRIDQNGQPQVDFSTATPEQLKAITSIASKRRVTKDRAGNVTEEQEAKFSMADKYRGLELLGKHLGMFKESEQRVVVDVADRLLHARQRLMQLDHNETE